MTTNSFKHDTDTVAIFGVPRSGTSWIGQIFNSSPRVAFRFQPLFSYEFKNRLNNHSKIEDIEEFYADLWGATSDFVLQKTNISGEHETRFTKKKMNTLVWKEVRYINLLQNLAEKSDTKLILVTRHPCAVINSWLRAPREFNSSWDMLTEWQYAEKKNQGRPEEYNGYDKWKQAMEIFLSVKEQYPDKTHLVKYEDLVASPLKEVGNMFDFTGIALEQQTWQFLQDSTSTQNEDVYGVYRTTTDVNKWKKQLDSRIADEILTDFHRSGLKKRLGY